MSNTIPESEGFFPKVTSNASSNQDSGKKEAAQKERLMKGLFIKMRTGLKGPTRDREAP